jgi:tetratricopeptide (TPR) repeat protein
MLKSQYIIIIIAIIGSVSLFLLPKSVVSNKSKTMTQSENPNNPIDKDSIMPSDITDSHQVTLSKEQTQVLERLRPLFLNAKTDKEKSAYLDSLSFVFRPANLIDSIAFYAENLATQFPSVRTYFATADAYYDVFSFAMNEQKVKNAAEKARIFYEKILGQEPENSDAKVKLGVTYTITATPMQGIKMIREVLEKEPDNQLALFNLGLLSMQSGQYERAVERFERLLVINPKDINACLLLGQSLINLNKPKEAIARVEKFKATLSNSPIDIEIKQRIDIFLTDLKK